MHDLEFFYCFKMRFFCILLLEVLEITIFYSLKMRWLTIWVKESGESILWLFEAALSCSKSLLFLGRLLNTLFCLLFLLILPSITSIFLILFLLDFFTGLFNLAILWFKCIHQHFKSLFRLYFSLLFFPLFLWFFTLILLFLLIFNISLRVLDYLTIISLDLYFEVNFLLFRLFRSFFLRFNGLLRIIMSVIQGQIVVLGSCVNVTFCSLPFFISLQEGRTDLWNFLIVHLKNPQSLFFLGKWGC